MNAHRGKVALITGAGSGIGRGMVEAFTDAGLKVAMADVVAEALTPVVETLKAQG